MSSIAFNDDWCHFFTYHSADEMTIEGLRAFAKQYEGTQITDFFLNPNGMRTVYASKVRESVFTGFDPDNPDNESFFGSEGYRNKLVFADGRQKDYIQNTWTLNHKGIDPYVVWMEVFREIGIHPWISMRMNDVHGVLDEHYFLHDAFWRNHPDMRTGEYRWNGDQGDRTLDYGREEVYSYQMALVDELIERYDMDGFELDWMRTPPHFRPGFDENGIEILTKFTREVREKLDVWGKKRGHKIRLSARVPHSPEDALGLGMDAAAWIQDGLIDWLTVSPYFSSTGHDVPIRVWKQLLRGTHVTLAVCTDIPVRAYPEDAQMQQSSVTACGQAAAMLWQGADVVYLFNHYDNGFTILDLENYREMLCTLGTEETLRGKHRRHIVSYRDCVGRGMASGALLPVTLPANVTFDIRLCLGDVSGVRRAFVAFSTEGHLLVRVNGCPCDTPKETLLEKPAPTGKTYTAKVPLMTLHNGWNNIEILTKEENCLVNWVEMDLS